jgi:hypothetical protein
MMSTIRVNILGGKGRKLFFLIIFSTLAKFKENIWCDKELEDQKK